ncbi:MAG TPA: hypothetical protein VMG10_03280 [Gemmataceae bacterium]|nr:hypothetical protein [Gemmataceae bacterium]
MKRYHCLVRSLALEVILLAALATTACGKGEGKVSGVVTYQGKPVSAGTVLFVGDDKMPARGPIHSDGSYQVNHVPTGNVKIAVLVPPPSPAPYTKDPQRPPPSVAIPPKYMNADTSEMTYKVSSGSQTHDLKLK